MTPDSREQRSAFVAAEGDGYFERNRGALERLAHDPGADPVSTLLMRLPIAPEVVLEVGCSNGWRLESLRVSWGARCVGIDPSAAAVSEGSRRYPDLSLQVGTAESLPYAKGSVDLLIFGFCLYLCDREDLFKIAFEADRVLSDPGHVVIWDFDPPFAYRNRYAHADDLFAYKMRYEAMFDWNPAYRCVARETAATTRGSVHPDDALAVSVLRKDSSSAYLTDPWNR